MKEPVAVIDIAEKLTLSKAGVNGHSLEVVTGVADSEEGSQPFTIVDINGSNTSLTFLPLGEGKWKVLVFDYVSESGPFREFIEEVL